ncbi:MAG: hypothetical protein ACTMIR_03045 [Cellulomonadaceae bacterium]
MSDFEAAADPRTSADELRRIAAQSPELGAIVAQNPSCYPELLDWLAAAPDPATRLAAQRRSSAPHREQGQSAAAPTRPAQVLPAQVQQPAHVPQPVPAQQLTYEAHPAPVAPQAALSPPATEHPAKAPTSRRRRWPAAVAMVAVAAVAIGAIVGIPRLIGAREGQERADAGNVGAADGSDATFLDGAALGWDVDARDLVPERPDWGTALFDLPLPEDAESGEVEAAAGLIEAAGVWVTTVGYYPEGEKPPSGTRTGGAVVGIDPATGSALWATEAGWTRCVPVTDSAQVACSDDAGNWAVLDASDGQELWYGPSTILTVAGKGDTIVTASVREEPFTGEQEGINVTAYEADGEPRWESQLETESFFDLEIADGIVLASGGRLEAFDAAWGYPIVKADDASGFIRAGKVILFTGLSGEGPPEIGNATRVMVLEFEPSVWNTTVADLDDIWLRITEGDVAGIDATSALELWTASGVYARPLDHTVERGGVRRVVAVTRPWDSDQPGWLSVDVTGRDGPVEGLWDLPVDWSSDPASTPAYAGLTDGVVVGSYGGEAVAVDALSGDTLWHLDLTGRTVPAAAPQGALVALSDDRRSLARYVPAPPGTASAVVEAGTADGVPDCPGDTVRLAWAQLTDGWVLVCGYSAAEPTYWAMTLGSAADPGGGSAGDGDALVETTDVVWDGDLARYTAVFDDGSETWLEHTPSVLGARSSDGTTWLQESVHVIFVELGEGGQTQGTGAYGVEAPERTAADQVRYLDQILRRSEEARSELRPAVDAVAECLSSDGDYSAELATIAAVRENRAELLAAIEAAPVDLVPQGVQLINELTHALQASWSADDSLYDWATDVHIQGCGAGDSGPGTDFSREAGTWKTAFAERWNTVIVPDFDVAEVSREGL